jgi:hypothetical protein
MSGTGNIELDAPVNMDKITEIARICHEVNRAYCASLGDDSQPSWENAEGWQRESAIAGVLAHIDTEISPKESHSLWCTHKVNDGWSWGLVKDAAAKKHPCLVPYDLLPVTQRTKDYLFAGVVRCFK